MLNNVVKMKPSLLDFAVKPEDELTLMEKCHTAEYLRADEVMVAYKIMKSPKGKIRKVVNVKIGERIAKELGWKHKDKVLFYVNPDCLSQIKIVKTDQGIGYALSHAGNTKSLIVDMTWTLNESLFEEKRNPRLIEFLIHKGVLLLDCNDFKR